MWENPTHGLPVVNPTPLAKLTQGKHLQGKGDRTSLSHTLQMLNDARKQSKKWKEVEKKHLCSFPLHKPFLTTSQARSSFKPRRMLGTLSRKKSGRQVREETWMVETRTIFFITTSSRN